MKDKWIKLILLSNCFNEGGSKQHLGFRYKNKWWCITHCSSKGILIPKEALQMDIISNKSEYIKIIHNQFPHILKTTNMKINKLMIKNYEKFKHSNL